MATPAKAPPNLLLTRLQSERSGEHSQAPATPYTEDVPEIINVEEDTETEAEDEPETSSVFTRSQVFVVAAVSKAVQGYRPAVVLDGHLAELAAAPNGAAGFTLTPVGSNQQLSFKYEPPSPKFTRKRPHALSYRLQLLQGSQFLYSLRGLPTVMRCQRNACALEWGPAHVVFAYPEDMELFLATLKYVEPSEVGAGSTHTSSSGAAPPEALSPGQAAPQPGARVSLMGTSRRQLNASEGGVGSMLWGQDAAALWMADKPRPASGTRRGGAAMAPAAGGLAGAVGALVRQLREQPAATAAAAAAAAFVVAAAAYLVGRRGGGR
ncbi:hypothetical protein HYH02_001299 [Chlamydomonas schloesseri]|uniref:Uncharacterized protein n=1 Tax=Chlamydomonas schloesseri TaxID=2026947 RepID=A0A836BC95_9CHLO|nr:hypothetical protein HYH02_001299 [Chlamydomonas schloesseri]|eukprot:KAG2454267.1 hypothetical protein HYH02_001299 [Chlamydomonas schloesseri]